MGLIQMGAGAGVTVPLSGGRGVIRAGPEVVEAVLSVWRGGRWAEGPRGPPCLLATWYCGTVMSRELGLCSYRARVGCSSE